ncbi:retrovirus-related Pol polyprotein from transposon 412 [Trichonephila clavipes]|nr:retrovirus-related Pol polyprotein from transposon 412 [Trichonephila clavipes]
MKLCVIYRQDVFSAMHNLSHPGIRRSVHLMKQRFVWPSISSDVAKWARHCLACQKSKIHRHTRSPLSSFQEPSQRFDHVHLDLIGPLPPSNGYTYCMTMIDRFSKWPEAQPLKDITVETVAEAFFSSWVSRFGTPAILTIDRGRQFESSLFKALSKLLGVQKCRTTGYHPRANGIIEELHRPFKYAIKCHATERWTKVLPIILLGLRASLKGDILCTPAELVFGTTIRLPGEMFDSSKPDDDVVNFVLKLKSHMQSLHPKPPKNHGKRPVFIHPGLMEATHVFLRRDMLRRPLQQLYDDPFKVLQRKDKVFFRDINGKRVSVSIDRCKPAFFLNTEDLQLPQTKNETPATVEPNATAPTPATVEHDPTASTPTQPSTRSGRKVHLPTRYEVELPWKCDSLKLPSNKELVWKRHEGMINRFGCGKFFMDYQKVFKDWEKLNIIERVPDLELNKEGHYLAHRPVIKLDSQTTQIHPVFDTSASEKGIPSLNECLLKGTNLIELIPDILYRFRMYPIGISADIEKDFLMLSVAPKDRDFLRFFSRVVKGGSCIGTAELCSGFF